MLALNVSLQFLLFSLMMSVWASTVGGKGYANTCVMQHYAKPYRLPSGTDDDDDAAIKHQGLQAVRSPDICLYGC